MNILEIREKLYTNLDKETFDISSIEPDLQGWLSDDPVLPLAIEKFKPQLIVEVGTWKGRSAINMAKKIKKLTFFESSIICVDTWLGSPEHFFRTDESRSAGRKSLRFAHGYPQLYYTFLANIIREGVDDVITPLPATSENAAVILSRIGCTPNMIYLDAAHEFEAVLADLKRWWPLLDVNGVLIGDDFDYWPGVRKAVEIFCKETTLEFYWKEGKFLIHKGQIALNESEIQMSKWGHRDSQPI